MRERRFWGGGQHGKRKDASEARSSSAGVSRASMAAAAAKTCTYIIYA